VEKQLKRGVHGLRAVAVVLVILYHVGQQSVPGGWVGVDLFFVISGYLITGQLLRAGLGGLPSFYLRRAARILPALSLVLIAYVLLPPINQGDVAGAAPAALFVSNLSHAGEISMKLGPSLEHTWSLAQEEQFYAVWPLLLLGLLLLRPRGRTLAAVLALATVGALYLNWRHGRYADPIQHSGPLLAGCMLAAAGCRCDIRHVGWGGLGLLAIFLYAYSGGHYADWEIVSTVAATLIVAGSEHLLFLFERPFQWIGTYSYGIYLWHLPLLYLLSSTLGGGWRLFALVLTPVVAMVSYHAFELPARRLARRPRLAFATSG
jgi:peptidoglycan/LPS O-acetylase OafA/YrhL